MSGTGVRVEGLRETVRTLEKFGVAVTDLKAAFKRIGTNVANDASNRAPKLTGRLSASIKPSNTKNKSVIRAGSSRIPYAGVIHYGGYNNIQPHPFMTDAVVAQRSNTMNAIENELRALIYKYNLN